MGRRCCCGSVRLLDDGRVLSVGRAEVELAVLVEPGVAATGAVVADHGVVEGRVVVAGESNSAGAVPDRGLTGFCRVEVTLAACGAAFGAENCLDA